MREPIAIGTSARLCDAYGPRAAQALHLVAPHFDSLAEECVHAFYRALAESPRTGAILDALGEGALPALKRQQLAHFKLLVSPRTTRDQLVRRATDVGRIHALVGLSSSLLVNSRSLYRNLLSVALQCSNVGSDDRYALLQILEDRLQDDLESQIDSRESVIEAYFGALSRPLAASGRSWPDTCAEELEVLGQLPGIRAALLLRLNQDGNLIVERAAGQNAQEIAAVMQSPSTGVVINPASPRGQGLAALAWRTRRMQSTPSYSADPRLQFWAEVAQRLRVQSTFALPVLDAEGHPILCIYLYGAYPNQFESNWMCEFGGGLQRRWEQTWQRSRRVGHFATPQGIADAIRERIFGGGLTMYAQPIVDLSSGAVHSLEALARLSMPDGTIMGPAHFLPLLGNVELDRLFQLGLEQVLDWLAGHGSAFAQLRVSINIAPSTLLNPDCMRWLREGIGKHGIAPQRLCIEILEAGDLHSAAQQEHLQALADAGFELAMDDLGSGYSSLERLSRVPFDVIKIDQALLSTIDANPEGVINVVGSLIQMVNDLERVVVVEGLENEGTIEAVTALGAQRGQGFGISKPMPLREAAAWLRSHTPARRSEEIRTPLGALAYHWRYRRALGGPKLHADLARCPLTDFFRCFAPRDPEIHQWHAQIHAGEDVNAASRSLNEWIVHKVTHQ